jgi:pectin methylesterase-like acyl-CoA thioesterase
MVSGGDPPPVLKSLPVTVLVQLAPAAPRESVTVTGPSCPLMLAEPVVAEPMFALLGAVRSRPAPVRVNTVVVSAAPAGADMATISVAVESAAINAAAMLLRIYNPP